MPEVQPEKPSDFDSRLVCEEALFRQAHAVLQDLLEKSGLTQRELAARLELTEGRISQIFRGADRNLTLRTCAGLAWAMGAIVAMQVHASRAQKIGRDPIDLELLVANAPAATGQPMQPPKLAQRQGPVAEPETPALAA